MKTLNGPLTRIIFIFYVYTLATICPSGNSLYANPQAVHHYLYLLDTIWTILPGSDESDLKNVVALAQDDDTIQFLGQSNIHLSSQVFVNDDLTFLSPHPDSTIIDTMSGFGNDDLFVIGGGKYVQYDGFTFRNGGGDLNTTTAWGGAILALGNITLNQCVFENNNAAYGGAIRLQQASLDMNNCIFRNNHAREDGGAIYALGVFFISNVYNCLFENNTAGNDGGAFYNSNSILSLHNCTLIKNQAPGGNGGGIFNGDYIKLFGNIFHENSATSHPDVSGTGYAAFSNIFSDVSGSNIITGIDNNLLGDPFFVDFAGGNYRLFPGSPCIDLGFENAFYPASAGSDLDWNPRVAGDFSDLGAYENTSAATNGSASVSSLFADETGQDGNMFTIKNESNWPIIIDSFFVNVAVGDREVEVYYTTSMSTHVGSEMNASAWTFLGSAMVSSSFVDEAVLLPVGGLTLGGNESKGIYITGTDTIGTLGLRYTMGAASELYSDGILSIDLVNNPTGNVYPFGNTFPDRQWNGTIFYSVPGLCAYERNLPFDPILPGIYAAQHSIFVTGRVAAGSEVSLKAYHGIQMNPEAEIEGGAVLLIDNEGCDP